MVDTEALVRALRAGRIRAALDVTDPEPLPPDHPLWTLPGVLITPHVGGDTDAMDDRVDDVIVEQVRRHRARASRRRTSSSPRTESADQLQDVSGSSAPAPMRPGGPRRGRLPRRC